MPPKQVLRGCAVTGRAVEEARTAYQDGLPPRYSAARHHAALGSARRGFWAAAVGPAAGACAARLEQARTVGNYVCSDV